MSVAENKNLSASLEDYLEAIFQIVAEKQAVRAKDIAKRLKVNSSSVTGALHNLAEKGLVNYAPYDVITLTPSGQEIAESVIRRHNALLIFFTQVLDVEVEMAEECACKMEHAMPREIIDRLNIFLEFIDDAPSGGSKWVADFHRFIKSK